MLSMHRGPIDIYSQRKGRGNPILAIGITSELGTRGGEQLQTSYANLALPFALSRERASMLRWIERGNRVKIAVRFEVGRHPQTCEPAGLTRALSFDSPRAMDLPPDAAWDVSHLIAEPLSRRSVRVSA